MDDAERILISRHERPKAVSLRLDNGEILEVAHDALPPDLPGVGESISSPLLAILRTAAARKLVARRLFELLDRKLWTMARLRRKLADDGHPPEAVDAVLAQAEAAGLHSDQAFAQAFCRDALRTKAVGRSWLEVKLREKGVPAALAREVASVQLPPEREAELADRAAAQRWRRESGRDRLAMARVQRFLASRGFRAGLCGDAARRMAPGPESDDASCNSDDEGPS